jgi:hypothetical protein
MAMATRTQSNTGRTIAMIGGGALLAWLLLRGRGRGKGSGGGGGGGGHGAPAVVEVWLRSGDRIELDGASSNLTAAVARARTAGTARVFAAGDTRQGWVTRVIAALKAAGVAIEAAPSLLR